MQRLCKYCGTEYSGDPGSTACPACVARLRSTTIRDRVCRTCGATFPGGPRAWYCPTCRTDRRREADRRHKRTGVARKLGSTDLCQICGRPYTVTSGLQKYCPTCAPEAVRAIDRQQSAAWNQANTTPDQRREDRQACAALIPCAVCGKPFVPDSRAHTCSPECQAAYAKLRAAAWEREHRQQRNEYRKNLRSSKKEDKKMTPKQYYAAVAETANYTDRDAYISDLALSAIWGDAMDADIPADLLEDLGQIWDATHRTVKQILAAAGLSQARFCERFLIPRRTVEDWCSAKRSCAIYDRMMFQQLLGLLTIEIS